jgi:HK97 family phage major capsid protein
MSDQVRTLEQELHATVAELRKRVTDFGDWREADSLHRESLDKLNSRIDEVQDELKDLTKAALRTTQHAEEEERDTKRSLKAAFERFLRKGEERLTPTEREALDAHQKALSVDSDPDGGFVVTPDTSGRISTIIWETSPVRQVAAQQSIGTDALEGLFDGDQAAVGWVAERGARAETATPQLGTWRIPTHEIYAAPRATQKLLDDANINAEAWLAQKVAERFARFENTAFVLGTGNGQPRGFMTYPAGVNRGQIQQLASGVAGAGFLPENLIAVVYSLKTAYRAGAVWAMNRNSVSEIRQLRDNIGGAGTGQFMWQPGMQAGQPSTLLGYPIVEMEDLVNSAATPVTPAAFGNFRAAYQIVDRIGIRVLRDPYTVKPYVEFYTTKRVGGDVINFEAIKIVVGS